MKKSEYTFVCDKCYMKVTSSQDFFPGGWRKVSLNISGYANPEVFDVCSDCIADPNSQFLQPERKTKTKNIFRWLMGKNKK